VADGAAQVTTVPTTTYDPGAVNLGMTYYWKVAEVNEAETPSVWDSPSGASPSRSLSVSMTSRATPTKRAA
jgi:hypothetical protein